VYKKEHSTTRDVVIDPEEPFVHINKQEIQQKHHYTQSSISYGGPACTQDKKFPETRAFSITVSRNASNTFNITLN
jgi:hypothetical protein